MERTTFRIGAALGALALVLALASPVAGQAGPPSHLFEKLRNADPSVRIEAAEALAQAGPVDLGAAAPVLRPALRDPEPDIRFYTLVTVQVAASASEEGARSIHDLAPALLERLGDPEARVRAAATDALAMALPHTPASATGPLLDLLDDPDAVVRKSAVGALARLGEPSRAVTDGLVKALLEDPAAPVRGAAARALAARPSARDPEVLEALIAGLADPEASVRADAANALGKLGPAASPAVAALERLVQDPEEAVTVRDQARYALRSIRGPVRDRPDRGRERRPGA